jgi:hypothetical protein
MLLRKISSARLVHCCLAAAIATGAHGAGARAWERPHADSANTGFANVVTAPAAKAPITIPNLGTFAPGAGPVVAPDGTVYIGNEQGKLMSFRPDGSPGWSRDIARGEAIVASPVIDAEGSVYVVGVKTMRDNRVDPPVTIYSSTLHKFNSSGAWLFQKPFPQYFNGTAARAPLNIWKTGAAEVLMVPVAYPDAKTRGFETHLFAFSRDGDVMADGLVTRYAPTGDVTGGGFLDFAKCLVTLYINCIPGFSGANPWVLAPDDKLPANTIKPAPGVAILSKPGATPFILVSDGFQNLVGMTFSGNGFNEFFRVRVKDGVLTTPPTILPNGHTIIGTSKGLQFAGPGGNPPPGLDLGYKYISRAAPTRLADGRVAIVLQEAGLLVVQGTQTQHVQVLVESIASAAASRTHLFVSTASGFYTYDANTLKQVAKINWVGGGLNPPAIGPKGHVYAIASNILFVFPSPKQWPGGGATIADQPMVATQPGTPPKLPGGGATIIEPRTIATDPGSNTQPAAQTYKPPLTANGNRLFACEELDQDDCGKGDYTDISLAWCQKQGYVKAKGYDVDSRKVKAETLSGQFCSKNKCKVFDTIACEM